MIEILEAKEKHEDSFSKLKRNEKGQFEPKWSEEEIRHLIKEYPKKGTDIPKLLDEGWSRQQIKAKAHYEGLSFEGYEGKVEKKCDNCGRVFKSYGPQNRRFCSRDCYLKYMRSDDSVGDTKFTGENNPNFRRVRRKCKNCDNVFEAPVWMIEEGKGKFCSKECFDEWWSEPTNHPNWKGDKTKYGYTSRKKWKQVREEVLQRDNYRCQYCGRTLSENFKEFGESINVHHIEPFKETKTHEKSNLITLCSSCHGKQHGSESYDN